MPERLAGPSVLALVGDMTSDWACIAGWMAAGAEWAFVDRCTLTHRLDH